MTNMRLRPGKTCAEALKYLEDLSQGTLNDLQNLVPRILYREYVIQVRGTAESSFAYVQADEVMHVLRKYDEWTGVVVAELSAIFADSSIPARVRGERYIQLLGADPASVRTVQLLNTELSELRQSYFGDLANRLREIIYQYRHHGTRTLVLDTNDLLHYMRFDKIPWVRLFGEGTVVVIPHVVVDEIDKKSYHAGGTTQRRARAVYALLEEVIDKITREGQARLADGTVIEVLADEPGHVRLLNNDDEIVARACYLSQAIAPISLNVITGDNGMRARAMAWGLNARTLDEKYKIERLSAEQKAADLAEITFSPPVEPSGDVPE